MKLVKGRRSQTLPCGVRVWCTEGMEGFFWSLKGLPKCPACGKNHKQEAIEAETKATEALKQAAAL